MGLRIVFFIVILGGVLTDDLTSKTAQAAEASKPVYSLADLLALAEEHSPRLAGAVGLVRQSRGQQIAAGAFPNPSISGSAGRGAIRDPSTGVRVTERTVTLEQPLEWVGKRQARQEAANAGLAGANAALEETRLALLADVKVAFYSLLLAQRDAELTAQNVIAVEDVLRTVKARVAAGEATSFDTMKATVEVQKARKEVARAQNALFVARMRLNTLTAGTLGREFSIHGEFQSLTQGTDLDRLTADPSDHHPSLRRLSKVAEQAEQTVRFERQSRVPDIRVHGTYHREAGDEAMAAGLSLPLPLWYRREGEIEAALGLQYRAEAERRRVQHELEETITQHAQEVRTGQAQLLVFETGLLKQAEQTLTVARSSFREGAASLLDLLDAQRVHRQTLLEYAQVRADLSIALVRLEQALGAPL